MPQKNTIKEYAPESYYHIYFRGTNKRKIFVDAVDFRYFQSLFERYLSGARRLDSVGTVYPNYSDELDLIAFCFMGNHVHMLVFQHSNPDAIRKLMSSLLTSYSKYFNKKYRRVGSLFESRYKAKRIDNDAYLTHISRYIHMNPRKWQTYRYSSLPYFSGTESPKWLKIDVVLDEFKNSRAYMAFLEDYEEQKESLKYIKHQLADS